MLRRIPSSNPNIDCWYSHGCTTPRHRKWTSSRLVSPDLLATVSAWRGLNDLNGNKQTHPLERKVERTTTCRCLISLRSFRGDSLGTHSREPVLDKVAEAKEDGRVETVLPKPTDHANTENDEACSNLWSVYIQEAERYDKALVDSWKGDMDGILIFASFSSSSTQIRARLVFFLQRSPHFSSKATNP